MIKSQKDMHPTWWWLVGGGKWLQKGCSSLHEGCYNAVSSFKNCISCRLAQLGLMSTTIVPCCGYSLDII